MKYSQNIITLLYIVFMGGAGFVETTSASEKPLFEQRVKIEHAEIILPTNSSDVATAFLVIWNGTGIAVDIESIRGQSGIAQLVSDVKNSEGKIQTVTSSMPRFIPPHSELVMRRSGHYLTLPIKDTLENNSNYLFVVEFSDGGKLVTDATILPAGSSPTHHHHGSNDS